jgi:tRNA(His) 5'-end guanylyltransferase
MIYDPFMQNTNKKFDKDPIGSRMKSSYEDRTRYCLPRRTYTILRLDGKSFHFYTQDLDKPFDAGFIEDMNRAVVNTIHEISQGVAFAYAQSDEISILLTDFENDQTDAWFGGNIQKMSSVAASIMTAQFNRFRHIRHYNQVLGTLNLADPTIAADVNAKNRLSPIWLPYFDCRAFTIPDRTEVMNYFRWRQQDCIRNSLSMVAQSMFSHGELQNKSQIDMHEMLHQKGVNWATDYTAAQKNGRIFVKETKPTEHMSNVISWEADMANYKVVPVPTHIVKWQANEAWVFSKDEGKLLDMIPKYA